MLWSAFPYKKGTVLGDAGTSSGRPFHMVTASNSRLYVLAMSGVVFTLKKDKNPEPPSEAITN